MLTVQRKDEKGQSLIIAFTPSKGATLDHLRAVREIAARRAGVPVDQVFIRYYKQNKPLDRPARDFTRG